MSRNSLYGPAVFCKPNVTDGDNWSCASVIQTLNGACAPEKRFRRRLRIVRAVARKSAKF